jgi:hypothetical protein
LDSIALRGASRQEWTIDALLGAPAAGGSGVSNAAAMIGRRMRFTAFPFDDGSDPSCRDGATRRPLVWRR